MRQMKPSTILKKARKLIERGWCQGPCATDVDGRDVSPTSDTAVCFCAWGAVRNVVRDDDALADQCHTYIDQAGAITFPWSKNVTQEIIVSRVGDAIALALKEGR